jgi:hypothetical protein
MEVNGQLHDPTALHLGKEPLVPTEWDVGWCPRTGLDILEKKNVLCLPGPKPWLT